MTEVADLRLCPLADLEIPDESVDLILTDPPYPREFLPTWGHLADLAVRILKPGGSLIAMSGQNYLPAVFAHLEREDLSYCWTFCNDNTATVRQWPLRLFIGWKPILWYAKGKPTPPRRVVYDRIRGAEGPDKRYHHWGQDVSIFEDLLLAFSHRGDLVVDPFLGGGTTGVAAILTGRRFVGCDVDEEAVRVSKMRCDAAVDYLAGERARVRGD